MIPQFKDAAGTVWRVEITAGVLTRTRTNAGVEIGSILTDDGRLGRLLYGDPEGFASVLYECCRSQIVGLDRNEFLDLLNADAMDQARMAVVEAIANFTLPPAISKAFIANWRAVVKAWTDRVTVSLNANPTSSEPVTNSPA